MKTRLWLSLVVTVVTVGALLAGNLIAGNTPQLGIDLQGGVSVILEPTEPATQDDLLVIRDLIRDELERTGIAEPDVRSQGSTIVVDLPGVKDQQEALSRVDVSGVVELRPVVNSFECQPTTQPVVSFDDETDASTITIGEDGELEGTITVPDATVAPDETSDETPDDEPEVRERRSIVASPDDDAPATTTPETTTPETTTPDSEPVDGDPADESVDDEPVVDEVPTPITAPPVVTPNPTGAELLPTRDGFPLCVGPAQGTGEVFERQSAQVTADRGWSVVVGLRGGEGQAEWNRLASQCFQGAPTCPNTGAAGNGQLAIVLDSVIQSAPAVNAPSFDDVVSITGDFTRGEAEDLARILNRGAFPVEVEAQEVETISASAGSQSLRAAVIAGLIGVFFVLTFLVAYYRWLALVIITGLTVWASTVFVAATLVSEWTNFSLSLAGITGIIVAVGVTV
ncbi:MAG: hypothetical protein AAFP84_00295, partial [Actinomycetota bacterium]